MPPPPSILDHIGRTPLVPLGRVAAGLGVPVLAKCEHLNPGGSVKDRIALAIVDDAERRGLLAPGATLVEATAGNTGVGLALVAAVRGYRLVCVLPEKMSVDKRAALAALGAQILIAPNVPPHDPRHFQAVARHQAEANGWFLTDQFANPANVRVHEETTGPEIWDQTRGEVGALVAGVGTGGTLTGAGRYLKARAPGVRVVLADPVGSRLAHLVSPDQPDLDAPYQVEGIGGSVAPEIFDVSVVDEAERVTDAEAFAMTRRLWREEGLLVGGSSGTAVVAALRVARRGGLRGPVVVILADSWDRYFAKAWVREGVEGMGASAG
jgi:cysteine synthase